MNFVIANEAVVMPTYGEGSACQLALETLRSLFPGTHRHRPAVLAPADGGGSFHCITQQEPVRWLE
jgi:agmatine deiminase